MGKSEILVATLGLSALISCSSGQESLRRELTEIISGADATVGIALISDDGDTLTIGNDRRYPLMSVFKFHQALAVSRCLERNGRTFGEQVTVAYDSFPESFLEGTWSPMHDEYPEGSPDLSAGDLLEYTLQSSDNVACDILFNEFAGPSDVCAFIRSVTGGTSAKSSSSIGYDILYTELQMFEDHSLAYGNWTTPYAAALLLEKFCEGKVAGDYYTSFIKRLMETCSTGKARLASPVDSLNALYASGSGGSRRIVLGHKTGSGYVDGSGRIMATNDIGYFCLPDGKTYYLAVFVMDSGLSPEATEAVIAKISSAILDFFIKG